MSEDALRPAWAQEIRTRRHRLCWSQKELARRLELAADDKLRSQLPSRASIIREIRFHESGTHRPGPVYAELYRRVWVASAPELDGYPGVLRPSRSTDHSSTGAEEPAWIVAQARALTASNVDDYVLDIVERSIEQIIKGYENDGPWPLVEQVLGLRHTLHGLLEGRQSPRQRRELFRLAGGAAGLLGYMSVNLGRPLLCDAYCTEAILLAREAEDVELEMWVMGTRSFGLYYQGRYREADNAAAAGIALAPSSPQSIRLRVNGRARALARIRDEQALAERTIEKALALSARTPCLPEGMSSCIAFSPYSSARILANAVTAYLSLGDHRRVLEHASHLAPLVEETDSQWSKALVRLDTASALLSAADPDVARAMELGREALAMTAEAPIASVARRAQELAAHADTWSNTPETTGYLHHLRAWKTGSLARKMSDGDLEPTT